MTPRPTIDPEMLLEHAGFVRAAARAVLARDDEVDDAVQETWVTALRNGPRESGALRSWLGTVARSRAYDLVRKCASMRGRERVASRSERVPSTSAVAERVELGRILIDAVMGLPQPYRDVILLRYYDGLSPKRIGQKLGIPTETARTRVKRGLGRLRQVLDDRHGGDRRLWSASFAALAPRPVWAAAAGAVLLGMGVMKKVALVAIVLLAGLAAWQVGFRDGAPPAEPEYGPTEDPAAASPHLRPSARPPVTGSAARAGSAGLLGIVRQGDVRTAARVEFRRIGDVPQAGPLRWHLDSRRSVRGVAASGPALLAVEAAADGMFQVEGLAAGRYEIRATVPDGAWGFVTKELYGEGRADRVEIVVHGGAHALEGRCQYEDGRPFHGTVLLQAAAYRELAYGRSHALASVETATDGRFAIEEVAAGEYYLTAIVPDRFRATQRILVPTTKPLVFVVDPNLRAITGRVLAASGGDAIAGAAVSASYGSEALTFVDHATTSGADGRFSLRGGRGQALVRVRAPGFAPGLLRLAKGGDANVEIELERRGAIAGLVRRAEDGTPVAGVPVYAIGLTAEGWPKNELVRAVSDDAGRFVLEGTAAGEVAVFALGGGWASEGLASWSVPGANPLAIPVEAGGRAEVTLDVEPAPTVHGIVYDIAGVPCTTARVRAVVQLGRGARYSTPLYSLCAISPLGAGHEGRTGADGRFALDALVPGATYRFEADVADHAAAQSEPMSPEAAAKQQIELRLQAPCWADVEVRDADSDAPVAGALATLYFRPDERVTKSTDFHGATDEGGRLRLGPLPPGRYVLALRAAAHLPMPYSKGVEFDAELGSTTEVRATLRMGQRVAGRLTAPDGVAVDGTFVHLLGRSPSVRCGADGAFAFAGVAPGRYELRATCGTGEDLLVAEATVEAGDEEVILALVSAVRDVTKDGLLVRIHGPNGAPVSQGQVTLFGKQDGRLAGQSGVGFNEYPVVVKHVPLCDEIWLMAHGAEDATGERMPLGAVVLGPLDVGRGEIEVTLPAERRIRGRVVSANGGGAAGFEIRALPVHPSLPAPFEPNTEPHHRARTAADGSFELRYLGDLLYELRVSATHAQAPIEPVRVRAGSTSVRILAEPGLSARILLRDWQNEPVVGARLRYRLDPGAEAADARERAGRSPRRWRSYVSGWWDERIREPLISDPDGVVVLPGLKPEGTYELYVEGPASRTDLLPLTLLAWQPSAESTLSFERAYRIHGVVVDPAGNPVPGVRLHYETEDGRLQGEETDADGRFLFEALTVSELQVKMFIGWPPPKDAPLHRLEATDEPLTLTFDGGGGVHIRIADWDRNFGQPLAYLSAVDARPQSGQRRRVDDEGRVAFRGLAPGRTYVLWIPLRQGEGRHVYVADLVPDDTERVVTIQPGHDLRGRVHYLGSGVPDEIRVQTSRGNISATAVVDEDGAFVMAGLPEGTYAVRAIAYRHVARAGEAHPRLEHLGEATTSVHTGADGVIEIKVGE